MKCARCNRPLIIPAVSIKTKDGAIGFGPKCASIMRMVLVVRKARANPARKQETSEHQIDWISDDASA